MDYLKSEEQNLSQKLLDKNTFENQFCEINSQWAVL